MQPSLGPMIWYNGGVFECSLSNRLRRCYFFTLLASENFTMSNGSGPIISDFDQYYVVYGASTTVALADIIYEYLISLIEINPYAIHKSITWSYDWGYITK